MKKAVSHRVGWRRDRRGKNLQTSYNGICEVVGVYRDRFGELAGGAQRAICVKFNPGTGQTTDNRGGLKKKGQPLCPYSGESWGFL